MDCSPQGSSVHGDSQARILEWVGMPSSRRIFPTQGSNPGLLHCRWILYHLSNQGGPRSLFLLQGIFPTQESNQGLLHCRWILYLLSYQESPFFQSDFSKLQMLYFRDILHESKLWKENGREQKCWSPQHFLFGSSQHLAN